ncbi:MAG: glycosyl hydrolase family 18 protein [Bacteroidota bacterium]
MKKHLSKIQLTFFIAFFAVSIQAQTKTENLFYYVNNEQCFEALTKNIDKISIVAPQAFSVDEDGIVWGSVDSRVIELARAHTVGVMPLIVNPGFDQLMLHRLLVNPQARSRCISTLVDLCEQYKFLGIQFDFENLNMNDRDAFTKFYQETADALHKKGFKLSIAVVHRPEDYAGHTAYHKWLFENWRAGYDLAELAKAGDFISVMSYSQHTRRTTPGPNAGIPWVTQIVEYFLKFMPPEKLSLGIPLGSMHWYTALDTVRYFANARSWSDAIDHARALGILKTYKTKVQWSDEQKVSFAVFDNGGLFEYVYLEDARSFKAKYELLKQFKLRGFSAWVLGIEDPAIWNVLSKVSR